MVIRSLWKRVLITFGMVAGSAALLIGTRYFIPALGRDNVSGNVFFTGYMVVVGSLTFSISFLIKKIRKNKQ